ncbi:MULTISPECIES: hypothetical protein [Enterobacter cloacae complex]|uniref:hypothetical protein n=1 Tax=Enterobacter cloacae complex TaxID=354276 RepID=UPI000659C581|nr:MULTISPECIES: hypothetical protein [Enterobacter cloacae complex]KLW48323.1 hypothetical protein SK52_03099 [Enterobacter sp. MGH86]KLW48329.1 hypothetical protein SK52_03105 [Enterobacter sp. MGH86]MCR2782899.1 hypothetical protein [Enterobacter hormaechei]MCR4010236.1 hypothetical protein [Enterobacter hormaechei]MCR4043926.1 hypothetical protein [Enterobacter hormaechei]
MKITKQEVQAVSGLRAGYTLGHADVTILNELARIALASLEAQPVTEWTNEQCLEFLSIAFRHAKIKGDLEFDDIRLGVKMVNCSRAAVLQGKAELVTAHPELTVWYGSMPETNGKTNWTAMLHRKGHHPWEGITIDRSEYPERVRYEADRMRHLIGELTDEPDILAYDADAHSGYAEPVSQRDELPYDPQIAAYEKIMEQAIPDGYALVPVEPTEDMIVAGFESRPDESFSKSEEWEAYQRMSGCEQAAHRAKLCWAAMLKAAPQQEVK